MRMLQASQILIGLGVKSGSGLAGQGSAHKDHAFTSGNCGLREADSERVMEPVQGKYRIMYGYRIMGFTGTSLVPRECCLAGAVLHVPLGGQFKGSQNYSGAMIL